MIALYGQDQLRIIIVPIRDPHWEAGTTSLNVIGGLGTVPGVSKLFKS